MAAKFYLNENMFEIPRRILVENGDLQAVSFRYETGVEALEITNGTCTGILLPYQGFQVWRLIVDGEDMTMKSMFDVPEDTVNVFDESYGAFMIQCGLTSMGNPSEEDPHPMHGELPHAKYKNVSIQAGSDEKGNYLAVSGEYTFKISIDTGYVFRPTFKLYEGSKLLNVNCHIRNLRAGKFEYMYMSHINWMPIQGSQLYYSAPKDTEHIEVFREDFGDMLTPEEAKELDDFTTALQEDFSVGDTIDFDTQCYNPELCCCIHYEADEEGWSHAMQLRPDGTACYVGFENGILRNGTRWFCWTADERSCGFTLPTTGNHKGRAYAIEHDLRRSLGGYEECEFSYRVGKLDPEEAQVMRDKIEKIAGDSK